VLLALVLLPAVTALVGCRSRAREHALAGSTPPRLQGYADGYYALMVEFRTWSRSLESRPLPPPTLRGAERRDQVAEQLEKVADETDGFRRRLELLHPPRELTAIHVATRDLFGTLA